MFLISWLDEFLAVRYKYKENKIRLTPEPENPDRCESCETLRGQLALANEREKRLLLILLNKPEEVSKVVDESAFKPLLSGAKSWAQRRAELEANDRANAFALKDAAKKDAERKVNLKDIKEFEVELDKSTERRNLSKSDRSEGRANESRYQPEQESNAANEVKGYAVEG